VVQPSPVFARPGLHRPPLTDHPPWRRRTLGQALRLRSMSNSTTFRHRRAHQNVGRHGSSVRHPVRVSRNGLSLGIRTDKVEWESNAAIVLGMRSARGSPPNGIGCFNFSCARASGSRRQHAIGAFPHRMRRVACLIGPVIVHAGGRRSRFAIWLEDHGRWWPARRQASACYAVVIRAQRTQYQEEPAAAAG